MTFDWAKDVAYLIRDVRLSVFLCISSISLLFIPFQKFNLEQPSIVSENTDTITVIGILSFANLLLHFFQLIWYLVRRALLKIKRKTEIDEVFRNLNFEELCVLYFCTQAGIKAFKATPNSVIIMSLKAKGCIRHISGIQSALEMHFQIYDDIYNIVREHGTERFPEEFLKQYNWEEQVKESFMRATDWRSW